MVHIDSNHQAVIQQHVMAGKMVVWEIDAPLEHIRVHYAGFAFVLAGDNLHPISPAESVVETHALQGICLAGAGARNGCQSVDQNGHMPLEWANGFFFGNVELSLELWTVIAGISGFDD